MSRALFIDRDGTIIEEREYLSNPDGVRVLPGVPEALLHAMGAGMRLIIVTNQSGIGRGLYTLQDMKRVNARICEELGASGVRFDRIYFSPEAPTQPSRGRKPSPQFLFDARDEFEIDLSRSYMIGDKLIDLECGWNAGVRKSILVRTGYGAEIETSFGEKLSRAVVVDALPQAVEWILRDASA